MSTVEDQPEIQPDVTTDVSRPGWRFGSAAAWRQQYWVALLAVYSIAFAIYGESPYITFNVELSRALPPRANVPFQYPLLALHVLTGSVAICLGWMQVWPWLRNNHPRVHRRIGWVYFLAGTFPAGVLALASAILTTAGQSTRLALFTLGVLWMGTTVLGFTAALQGRYADHRRWMLRNVALTTSIATVRPIFWATLYGTGWLLHNTYGGQTRELFVESYSTGIWGGLIVHVIVVEWLFVQPRRRKRRAAQQVRPDRKVGQTVG
jgi:hypothetical protein